MTEITTQKLEQRLQIIEDKLAIYELIASHPPSADTGLAEYTAAVYMEEGTFNRGEELDGAKGVDAIAAFILRPAHEEAIKSGLAHFTGLPLIDLRGNKAIVTSYLQLLQLDKQGEPREMANHGYSTGYRIHRVVVNRWELERHEGRWKIHSRTLLPVDGTDAPRELLARGLSDVLKATR
ncbi:nuclear transport factor 2 family protein [Pantoea sp. NPDC088449]|uniref:SnoaL-like domain-containing protein n=1 Tax=Candidatus Pantoea floridensis TaxID=1938870 RepID=A0A286BYA2_9GAMM|nr:nuclear transport factor 2 family protein [Pantoea floridensis]PIF21625.1 SnoaL-like protein [Enterobacteriaceae bacterium JKS000233]SOD39136.1 SnoaL-like domain-containing protein [Pantoea floridensis]HBZ14224.1 nuclear transport factor 2 family protein [Pantoea sp.]